MDNWLLLLLTSKWFYVQAQVYMCPADTQVHKEILHTPASTLKGWFTSLAHLCWQIGFSGRLINNDSVWVYWTARITAEGHNVPLVLVFNSPLFLRLPSSSPAAPSITCKASAGSACWNQTRALESFTPTMPANENDSGGEENSNETFQKSHTCLLEGAEALRCTTLFFKLREF